MFNLQAEICPKKNLKMFYLRMGWMGWDGMDGMGWDGWDGISKVSFNILHTLYVYR